MLLGRPSSCIGAALFCLRVFLLPVLHLLQMQQLLLVIIERYEIEVEVLDTVVLEDILRSDQLT